MLLLVHIISHLWGQLPGFPGGALGHSEAGVAAKAIKGKANLIITIGWCEGMLRVTESREHTWQPDERLGKGESACVCVCVCACVSECACVCGA